MLMLFLAEDMGHLPEPAISEVYGIASGSKEMDKLLFYLRDCFFHTHGGRYYFWENESHYVCALRLEPYQDGVLLEALETAPNARKSGYAKRLITEVQHALEEQGSVSVYSHVNKNNVPSIRAHESCGFEKYRDYAEYIDGTVTSNAWTMRWHTDSCVK